MEAPEAVVDRIISSAREHVVSCSSISLIEDTECEHSLRYVVHCDGDPTPLVLDIDRIEEVAILHGPDTYAHIGRGVAHSLEFYLQYLRERAD